MITVTLFRKNGLPCGFEISGHSGYKKSGSDIICASVSSCAYMVANTVTDVLNVKAELKADDGYMLLKAEDKAAQSLLEGFEMHMKALSEDHKKFIKVIYRKIH